MPAGKCPKQKSSRLLHLTLWVTSSQKTQVSSYEVPCLGSLSMWIPSQSQMMVVCGWGSPGPGGHSGET